MKTSTAKINMLKQQLRTWGVLDEHILELYANLPREQFVPAAYQALAYADCEIPLGEEHFLLPPKESALMLQALQLQPNERVLELGTGSGYHTALLANLAQEVISVDASANFITQASDNLSKLGNDHIQFFCQDPVTIQLKQPVDAIFVGASLVDLPQNLLAQLQPGARFCGIIGRSPIMEAMLLIKKENGGWVTNKLFETVRPHLFGVREDAKFVF